MKTHRLTIQVDVPALSGMKHRVSSTFEDALGLIVTRLHQNQHKGDGQFGGARYEYEIAWDTESP